MSVLDSTELIIFTKCMPVRLYVCWREKVQYLKQFEILVEISVFGSPELKKGVLQKTSYISMPHTQIRKGKREKVEAFYIWPNSQLNGWCE